MVSKAWKNFVNESLTLFEHSCSKPGADVEESYENPSSFEFDIIKTEKKSWCNTIDRSFGYAFKSFCRFVISRTLNESSILKNFEIAPSDFKSVIDRNFQFIQPQALPSLPNYYQSYPRYARWHNKNLRNQILFRTRKRCNLSYLRALTSSNPRARKKSRKLFTVELGRYQVVKPVNKFMKATLSMIFE